MDQIAPQPLIHGAGTSEAAWQRTQALHALARITLEQLLGERDRIVVLAPHPDDEVLGCGGLMAMAGRNRDVAVLSVTDGEASHPAISASRMRVMRARERDRALAELGMLAHQARRMVFPDGAVSANLDRVAGLIADITTRADLVLAPWRGDGHPDHEATYKAAALAQISRGFALLQYPVWGWHWCPPEQFPFSQACRLELDGAAHAAKQRAIGHFKSQTDARSGAAILTDLTLERFRRPFEVFLQ